METTKNYFGFISAYTGYVAKWIIYLGRKYPLFAAVHLALSIWFLFFFGGNSTRTSLPPPAPPVSTNSPSSFTPSSSNPISSTDTVVSVAQAQAFKNAKWYYTERASDEFQIKQGVYPPKNLTNSGAINYGILHSQLRANSYIRAEEEQLRAVGYSYKEIDEQKIQTKQTAYQKLDKDWKEEVTRNLEKWQEQKERNAVQNFVSSESENPSQFKEVKVSDLEAWRQEAQELNRSERHLDKIDRVISSSTEQVNKSNPNATVKISERDFKAMQRDRSEFKQSQEIEQRQDPNQNQSVARGRGR
jgi:hypothetical protein